MKRILLAAFCLVVVASFAMASGQTGTAGEAKTWVLKYNQLEKATHPQGVTQAKFKEKIEELSKGQITVQNYVSGTLFTQTGEVTAIMNGDLELSTLAFQDMAPYVPTAAMFAAPYAFTSYEHMEKVFAKNSKVAADFYAMISAKCGYTPLAAMTQGMRIINAKKTTPIKTPADMKDVMLRMPAAPAWLDAGKSLGANVTGIAYSEVYTALQTGTVNAQDNPLQGTRDMKFYEVTKQISLTKHIIDVKLLCVTNKVWNAMTKQQQKWMIEAAQYAGEQGTAETLKWEADNLKFFKDYGLIITEPDIKAFKAYSAQYYKDNGLTKDWDMDLWNRVQALAK
jgi:tripartite ATP-independent transporter DctP family solute receptor